MSVQQKPIPFAPPLITDEMIEEVVATLKSGWITTGPRVAQFERDLATYCGVGHVLCVNSATAGLELMLRWLGVGEGDEVILPAYTYCATANVVVRCGATPVMADVGPDYNMRAADISDLITAQTKAIIPVDIAGLPCDYQGLQELLESKRVKEKFAANNSIQEKLGRPLLLSDAAHSLGASIDDVKVGSIADATVFSFHAVKNLTTAEGGAIALNLPSGLDNEAIYNWMRVMTLHGQTKDARTKMEAGGWRYDVVVAGYKMNMTDIQAALGMIGLKHYDANLRIRAEIAERYNAFFNQFEWAELPTFSVEGRQSCHHLYLLKLHQFTAEQRDEVISKLAQEGIATNVHFQPLPLLTVYRELGYDSLDYPKSMELYSRTISLPIYPQLAEADQRRVCHAIQRAVESILSL